MAGVVPATGHPPKTVEDLLALGEDALVSASMPRLVLSAAAVFTQRLG